MKSLPKEEIQKMLSSMIKVLPCDYRCYEITRMLKEIFFKKGFNFEARDGYAFYCFGTFLKEARMKNCELFLEVDKSDELVKAARFATSLANSLSLEKNLYWRIGIRHSWGILHGEKYLIDCHRSIQPSSAAFPIFKKFPILKKIRIENFLIITPLRKTPTGKGYLCGDVVYLEKAVQVGNSICYPDINYSTELRL